MSTYTRIVRNMFAGSTLLLISLGASAEYACPDPSDSSGGWTPAVCTEAQPAMSTSQACPDPADTRGGWVSPACMQVVCAECGTGEAVNVVEADATGIGAVAGAVAGGLLGNQVGKGKGKTLATIVGAVGGGVAGHYGEKKGFDQDPGFKPGDKVKVENDTLVKN